MKCASSERKRNFHFQSERDSIYAYYFYQYTPASPAQTLNGKSVILCIVYFFPISWKFGHHKIFQAYHIFYSFWAPPRSRKKLVATTPCENLEIDFSINLNKYFWIVINTFKVALLILKNFNTCKAGSRHAVAITLDILFDMFL